MDKNPKQSSEMTSSQCSEISKSDRVIHDAELGEENVELVDSEWADFERALRYDSISYSQLLSSTIFKIIVGQSCCAFY